jgi:hypothetical protein
MAKGNSRKKHSFIVTVSFDTQLNEREALDAAKDLLSGFGGYCTYNATASRGVKVLAEVNGAVTSIRRGSIG